MGEFDELRYPFDTLFDFLRGGYFLERAGLRAKVGLPERDAPYRRMRGDLVGCFDPACALDHRVHRNVGNIPGICDLRDDDTSQWERHYRGEIV